MNVAPSIFSAINVGGLWVKNKIETEWGGVFHNRIKFPLLVLNLIRQRLPDNFLVGFRLMIQEGVPGGNRVAGGPGVF